MEPLSVLGPVMKSVEWVVALYRRHKESQMEAVSTQILAWFVEARMRGVYGRFCPSRQDIVEAFTTQYSIETIFRTISQLLRDGYLEFDDGRYLLRCKPLESPY